MLAACCFRWAVWSYALTMLYWFWCSVHHPEADIFSWIPLTLCLIGGGILGAAHSYWEENKHRHKQQL